ncbi:MAG: BACON domain-containing protein [Bryobacterales bacterium]|nr:BACON domain-containing protein [Bryobacterales bacterium]
MRHLLHCFVLCVLVLNAQEPSSFGGLRFRELPKPLECPTGINDLGEIIRGCWIDDYGYRISPDGVETQLPVRGLPAAINNSGQIVINQRSAVLLLHPDGRTERRIVDGARSVAAHGINNKGEIAGEADNKPVLWNAEGTPRFVTLPVAQGPQSYLLDVNDSGTMLGSYYYTGPFLFRWTEAGFFLSGNRGFDRFRASIANDGVMLSINPFPNGIGNYVSGPNFGSLFEFRAPRAAFAMSRNGRLLLGERFVAERCATEVTPRRAELPLRGGKVLVRVTAEHECEWADTLYGISGSGSAEIELTFDPLEEPAATHRTVAGKEIEVHQGVGACSFRTPGYPLTVPSTGGTLRIPVIVTEGCAWNVQSDSSWMSADSSISFTGSATVAITVEPNVGATERRAMLTLGPMQVPVVQGAYFCTYRVQPFGPLPAGIGAWTPPVETQPGCVVSLTSSAPWLLEIPSLGQVNFTANPTNTARSTTLTIAGQRFTITQEPSRSGEPHSVEPFDGSGPRQTFRFRFPEPLARTRLSIGSECGIEYNLGLRPFAVSGKCVLEDASSIVADGFRVLTVTVALRERGLLIVAAGGRQLGVFRSTDAPPTPLPVTRPTEIPANAPSGSSLWVDSRRGVGGIFRVRVDPSLGTPHSISFGFGKCVVTIQPAARTMRLENYIEADGPPKPTAEVLFGSSGKLQTPYCMADPERSRLALPVVDLAVFFPFHNAPSGTMRLSIVTTEGLPPVVTDLGSYVVTTTATAPVLTFPDGRMKVVFRSNVPIEEAQVEIGGCLVTYNRRGGSETNRFCSGSIETSIIGNDVVMRMNLSFLLNTQFAYVNIRTNFTPEGFSATGWFINYVNHLIGFNGAGP